MIDRLTLATATGFPLVALGFHFGTGLIALAAGFIAIGVRKGGQWHRRSGMIFVYAMIATGATAVGIATFEGKPDRLGGAIVAYFVITAYTAVKPLARAGRSVDAILMTLALVISIGTYATGFAALSRPGNQIDGVPAAMLFFLATVLLLGAVGDARSLRAGGLQGSRQLARHLWRMLFGLFIASGSFFIGQMKFIPEPIRILPVIFAVALSPLVLLIYWMWRVRLKQNVRGLMTTKPLGAPGPGSV